MFDIGGSELLLIGVVALIVIGPKELPAMFHTLGRFTAKARSMAREFQRAMDDAAKESGLNDVTKDLKTMTSAKSLGLDRVQQAAAKFEAWDPMKKQPTVKEPQAPQGPATAALAEERAEIKRKVDESAAARVAARQAEAADDTAPAAKPKRAATVGARAASRPARAKTADAAAPARKAPGKPAAKPVTKPAPNAAPASAAAPNPDAAPKPARKPRKKPDA